MKGDGFYTATQVARIARIPLSTLYEWQRKGIIKPTLVAVVGDAEIDAGYSYADLTFIRILRELREGNISFDSAATAVAHLYDRFGPPGPRWAKAKVYVDRRNIFAERPDNWGVTAAHMGGQVVEERLLGDYIEGLRESEEAVLLPRYYRRHVQISPNIMTGLPVVRGTRLPTSVVAEFADRGESPAMIKRHFPFLSLTQIRRAIEYERFLDRAA